VKSGAKKGEEKAKGKKYIRYPIEKDVTHRHVLSHLFWKSIKSVQSVDLFCPLRPLR
jgi:hypothetical protein